MPSVVDRLTTWICQTFIFLAALRRRPAPAPVAEHPGDSLIYRLKHWPRIPSGSKTADIYRTLSVMSSRPVNRRWILNNSSLDASQVDRLLRRLVEEDAVEVTDAAKYGPGTHAA